MGFKAISEVVESGMTVDLDSVALDFEHAVDYTAPTDLHIRAVDLPSLEGIAPVVRLLYSRVSAWPTCTPPCG